MCGPLDVKTWLRLDSDGTGSWVTHPGQVSAIFAIELIQRQLVIILKQQRMGGRSKEKVNLCGKKLTRLLIIRASPCWRGEIKLPYQIHLFLQLIHVLLLLLLLLLLLALGLLLAPLLRGGSKVILFPSFLIHQKKRGTFSLNKSCWPPWV